jgi:hypothetical protein
MSVHMVLLTMSICQCLEHPQQVPKNYCAQDYVTDLLKGWGGRDVIAVSAATLWAESRKVCECDTTPSWNDLIRKFPGGFPSGKDAKWTQSAL